LGARRTPGYGRNRLRAGCIHARSLHYPARN
jgi:hypothetical protein